MPRNNWIEVNYKNIKWLIMLELFKSVFPFKRISLKMAFILFQSLSPYCDTSIQQLRLTLKHQRYSIISSFITLLSFYEANRSLQSLFCISMNFHWVSDEKMKFHLQLLWFSFNGRFSNQTKPITNHLNKE